MASDRECGNCGQLLAGPYCHGCGQKRIEPEDRRFGHLLAQFVEALTDLDSRFWRSLRTLMFRPGLLSAEYLSGRRQRYMGPVALFILANVLYFIAPGFTDFELPFIDHIDGPLRVQLAEEKRELSEAERAAIGDWHAQWHSPYTGPWVLERVAERKARAEARSGSYSLGDYQRAYDQRRSEISRLLIILHVPALALLLWLTHPRSGLYYAEHFVVALHLFAFTLFLVELVVLPMSHIGMALGARSAPPLFVGAFVLVVTLYFSLALRRVYGRALWLALPTALLVLVGLFYFSVYVYRSAQFLLIFALT